MNPYLIFVLAMIIGSYVLQLVVDVLNVRHISNKVPAEFEGVYDQEKYQKIARLFKRQNYFRDYKRFYNAGCGINGYFSQCFQYF
ncbi:hypothetical protein ACFL2K_00105 [Candidatus Margulisiibacteriota bacterium]